MILRTSAKFEKLFRCKRAEVIVPAVGLLETWNVETCNIPGVGRFVLFSEEQTMFTVVVYSGKKRSLDPVLEVFFKQLQILRNYLRLPQMVMEPPRHFTKRTNRGVIGSQNDLIRALDGYYWNHHPPVTSLQLQDIHKHLNEIPLGYLKMNNPADSLSKLVQTKRR